MSSRDGRRFELKILDVPFGAREREVLLAEFDG